LALPDNVPLPVVVEELPPPPQPEITAVKRSASVIANKISFPLLFIFLSPLQKAIDEVPSRQVGLH
jgi:hypothetical protein